MFTIICSNCKTKIYSGDEVRSPKQVLRLYKGKCKKCGADLDPEDFTLEVNELS
ncbi:MAG: hypothetical protein QXG05_05250 [Nitrososphaerota archaeon]